LADPYNNQSRTVEITTPPGVKPERLDRYLSNHPDLDLSRTRIQKLVDEGLILVDGESVPSKYSIKGNERILVTIPAAQPTDIVAEDIPLDVVYEDDALMVVNKSAGMVTHPAAGNYGGTLVNALIHHLGSLPDMGASDRPGIVHRLDRDTSGLLVVAKTEPAYRALQTAIQKRKVKRTYLAVICGHVTEDHGLIDFPIGRSIKDRKKMTVTYHASREAKTEFELRERFRSYDLLDVTLHTGRTHQIRVHFSHLGHPVLGDPDYGGRAKWVKGMFAPERPLAKKLLDTIRRQTLHAMRLEFAHPVTGEPKQFEIDPPEDIRQVLAMLRTEGA